jgi:hypothetical protein
MATIKAKVQDAASSAKAGIDKARATAGEKVIRRPRAHSFYFGRAVCRLLNPVDARATCR